MRTVIETDGGLTIIVEPKLDRITIIPVVGDAVTCKKRTFDAAVRELQAPCMHISGDCGGGCEACRRS